MTITPDRVREIFKGLEQGDGAGFFQWVTEDVDWTVMGTHPLAGRYRSKKDFIAGTFTKLGQVLPQGAQLRVEYLLVKDDPEMLTFRKSPSPRRLGPTAESRGDNSGKLAHALGQTQH